MRIFVFLALLMLLGSCVSPKKVDLIRFRYDNLLSVMERRDSVQLDSIRVLTDDLLRAEGANRVLVEVQGNLEDKLVQQKEELNSLKGNLSSTSARLSTELAKSRMATKTANLRYDSLLMAQQAIVKDFERRTLRIDTLLHNALDTFFSDPSSFQTRLRPGEIVVSFQEELLFTPRSVDKLTDASAVALRAVMDILQLDPLLKLTVVGHTDNQPNPRRNTSNWEYAALRAIRIADELTETYYLSPNRVTAASHGEFEPITSNSTEEGRTQNRRVDFVLRNNVGNFVRELNKLEK